MALSSLKRKTKMATLSSLQDRLQGLGTRLQAENEAKSRERMTSGFNLDLTRERPGSERRPRPGEWPEGACFGMGGPDAYRVTLLYFASFTAMNEN